LRIKCFHFHSKKKSFSFRNRHDAYYKLDTYPHFTPFITTHYHSPLRPTTKRFDAAQKLVLHTLFAASFAGSNPWIATEPGQLWKRTRDISLNPRGARAIVSLQVRKSCGRWWWWRVGFGVVGGGSGGGFGVVGVGVGGWVGVGVVGVGVGVGVGVLCVPLKVVFLFCFI
jgi:hypothetical protein